VYFDDLRVHESKLLGNEDEGLYHIFDSLNVERVTIAAHTLALGKSALNMAVDYANEREVFDAPIGSHQAIQHPLADAYADLETAELLVRKGAWMYDNDEDMGSVANLCKLKAGDASWNASEAAMTTYGGMSASKDLGIATIWQIVRHLRTIPISEEMIYNYLGEHTLGLPRSY
jgi:acyl-CoA dehydrogenase